MNTIKIILSTALIDDNISIKDREIEYIESFNILKNLGYKFSIVETALEKSDFLESYSEDVIYTNVNGKYKNRGTNYVNAFKKFINNYKSDDDDIIVHITGRYPLINDSFFKECENLDKNKIGCFKEDGYNQFHMFLYALRYIELKKILNSINIEKMEREMINVEKIFEMSLPHEKLHLIKSLGIIGKQSTNTLFENYGKEIF